MFRRDLIDLVNSGRAWAFIGSGVSMDAGGPSWSDLLDKTLAALSVETRLQVEADARFVKARANGEFPTAFSRLQRFSDRETLETALREEVGRVRTAGSLHRELADWPFRGFITTNYDDLLERALRGREQRGWTAVGNSEAELRKLSGDPSNVVWHVHGSTALPNDKSSLVVTDEDYDAIYADDTPLLHAIRGLLMLNRLVFVGFGLSDPEFMRLIRRVGRFANPARPILAFSSIDDAALREELLERHNIDVINYRVVRDSHRALNELVKAHGGLVLRRSLRFRSSEVSVPSHDPETAGLLVYNELLLRDHAAPMPDVVDALLRSRVLALASVAAVETVADVVADLDARATLIENRTASTEENRSRVLTTLRKMSDEGVLELEEETGALALMPDGRSLIDAHRGAAELMREQFGAALRDRAAELVSDGGAADRIGTAALGFITECIERRALGVALATWNLTMAYRKYQMVALLQALPRFMDQLRDPDEAVALTRIVQDVLSEPSEVETKYIGLALQAQFGIHLLGVNPDALAKRVESVTRTAYVIDSNVLIDYLADAASVTRLLSY